jgi:hypothetical protein
VELGRKARLGQATAEELQELERLVLQRYWLAITPCGTLKSRRAVAKVGFDASCTPPIRYGRGVAL